MNFTENAMGSKKLTILQINDTHGYLEEHQEMFWEAGGKRHEKIGGYAKIAVILKKFAASAARMR